MSWSFNATGKPEALARAMDKYAKTLTGASKEEFDEALPHLKGVVLQNKIDPSYVGSYVKIDASGHGLKEKCPKSGGWRWKYLTTQVSVSQVYINLVRDEPEPEANSKPYDQPGQTEPSDAGVIGSA